MAGGGGRGNANVNQALVSGTGGQRGCVLQTSGLAMGLPSPVGHNAGSEPAAHVVACGGISRSGVPKWLRSPISAHGRSVLLDHPRWVLFHPYTSAMSLHLPKWLLLPWPHSMVPQRGPCRGGSCLLQDKVMMREHGVGILKGGCSPPVTWWLPGGLLRRGRVCFPLPSFGGLWEAALITHNHVCKPAVR